MKRAIILFLAVFFFALTFWAGILIWGFSSLTKGVVTGEPKLFEKGYSAVSRSGFKDPFLRDLPKLLTNHTYLVLLQNNFELRPSGGFMGSYAKLKFQDGVLRNWEVNDIYVPDGQIAGHVNPPEPIKQAFKHGFWRLRDANWDVDFEVAAKDIAWFFQKGGEENFDGIIAINFSLIRKWLEIVGPIKLADFSETVNSENFYRLTQEYVEEDFFPGSTQKKTFLTAVSSSLFNEIKKAGALKQLKIVKSIFDQLEKGQILLWTNDVNIQNKVKNMDWGGHLGIFKDDYLYVVETNLGANKANCCIERSVVHTISRQGSKVKETVEIDFANNNEAGRNYTNYLRVVIPSDSQELNIKVGGLAYELQTDSKEVDLDKDFRFTTSERGRFKIVGFWAIVAAKATRKVEINYQRNITTSERYALIVMRQPGIEGFPYRLVVDGKEVADIFLKEHDRTFIF